MSIVPKERASQAVASPDVRSEVVFPTADVDHAAQDQVKTNSGLRAYFVSFIRSASPHAVLASLYKYLTLGDSQRIFLYNDKLGWALNFIACASMIGSGLALPLMDVFFGGFVNAFNKFVTGKLTPNEYMDEVSRYTLYFVYLFVGKFCLTYTWTVFINMSAIRTTRALRVDFVRQALRQEVAFFESASSSISSQISANGNLIQNGISEKLGLIIQAVSMFVSAFLVAFAVQWKLTLITLAIVPVNTIITLGCIYFDSVYESRMFDMYAESGFLAEEAFSSIRMAHAFWAFPKLTTRFDGILERARQVGMKKSRIYAVLFPVEFFSVMAGYALAFWQGIRLYANGEIGNPGTVVTVLFAVLLAAQALTQIAPQTLAISKAMAAAHDLFAIIDRKSAADPLSSSGEKISSFQGDIKLRQVRFVYPSRPAVPVLHDLDLEILSGQTTAIVGASGSGKSTILGLLERWYEPCQGTITLDGHKLEMVNLRWLRTNIRLVQQEPTLFSGSIFENVANGLSGTEQDNISREEKVQLVTKACKAAFAHDFIQDLPEGYQTWVSQEGTNLSGGQKQRIVIARSIISDPKVLLLDEATSALDPNSEQIVQSALRNVARGRTTVMIAHRLSTVRDADRIIVMSRGRVMESGSHDELMRRQGAYSRLVMAQHVGGKQSDPTTFVLSKDQEHSIPSDPTKESTRVDARDSRASEQSKSNDACGFFYGLFHILKDQRVLWWHGCIILLCCLGGGVTYPALAVLFSMTLKTFETADVTRGNFFALMFFVVALGNVALYATVGWLSNIVAQAVMKFYRLEIFNNTLRQDMSFFDRPENVPGALVSRLASEPTSLQELLSINLSLIIICLVNLISSAILALVYGWKLGLILICGALPFLVGAGYLRIRLEMKFEQDTVGRFAESTAVASEAVIAIRTVSSLALEEKTVQRYQEKLQDIARHATSNLGFKMLFYSLSQSISLLAMGLGFWYGGKLISTGEYTSSQFYIVYLSIVFSGEAAAIIFQHTTSITHASAAFDWVLRLRRHSALHDREVPSKPDIELIRHCEPQKGSEVLFDNVRFSYPLRPNITVIQGFSAHAKPGSRTAFVGASGCGKSTMIALLERFYDATSGTLRVNHGDITKLPRQRYRRDVALVQQEPVLYQTSIRDNISLGVEAKTVPEEHVIEACKSANIWDFVSSLPQGLDTLCGSRGLSLSGGQRQRIAIARALIRKPRLLLLDEATSALDTESEKVVKEALDNAAEGRTTISVAHRLSTIQDADTILVFANGGIVEAGTHDELLDMRGIYYAMALGQSLDREIHE